MFDYTKPSVEYKPEDFEPNVDNEILEKEEDPTFIVKVNTPRLNLRSAASKESDSLMVLNEGDELLAQEVSGSTVWYKAYTEAGIEGYVMIDFVKRID